MDKPSNLPKFIRLPELSERLGVSRATIWRWERRGLLPPKRRLGPNTVAWVEAEIQEFMASRPAIS